VPQRGRVRRRPGQRHAFGESYGGLSVSAHLLSPGSRGLFNRAIVQSGFALMDLPVGAMFPGLPAVPWYGWRSTAEVETLGAAVAPGSAWPRPSATTPAACRRYPLSASTSPGVALATVLTDRMWARSTFALHRLPVEHVPTFAYEFADRQAPMYLPFPPDLPPGAFHAAEVPYLFPDDKVVAAATPAQRRLSDQLQQSLTPGDGGIRAVDFAAEHQLGFWEAAASSPGMS
jgi:hypothetical protein